MAITIRVPWEAPYDNDESWNDLYAWCIETFGVPDHKHYSWSPALYHMYFNFENEADALLFQLKSLGARCI
jgi:hypothetical protein